METLSIIENWVNSGSTLLDLGCGDGSMLKSLQDNKSVKGIGVEIDKENLQKCIERGLNVIEQDIDDGLSNFLDKSFDVVLVSQTIQVLKNPKSTLEEITRIGKEGIIVIPNFGHWRSRLTVLFKGKMPVTDCLPSKWYNTPNIHLCTLSDFESLCGELNVAIIEKKIINLKGSESGYLSLWPNLLGCSVIYKISK